MNTGFSPTETDVLTVGETTGASLSPSGKENSKSGPWVTFREVTNLFTTTTGQSPTFSGYNNRRPMPLQAQPVGNRTECSTIQQNIEPSLPALTTMRRRHRASKLQQACSQILIDKTVWDTQPHDRGSPPPPCGKKIHSLRRSLP